MSKNNGIASVNENEMVIDDVEKFTNHLKAVTNNLKLPKENAIRIKKASIKDELFLYVEYSEELQGHSKKETKLSCTVPVHEDLKAAFTKLHRHLAIISDYKDAPKKSTAFHETEFPKFGVRGFSIGGNDENEGVTISGYMEGKYGMVNINTPFTKFEGAEYPFLSELYDDVEDCKDEVEKYLFEGKRAPEKQLELFDGDLEPEEEKAAQ